MQKHHIVFAALLLAPLLLTHCAHPGSVDATAQEQSELVSDYPIFNGSYQNGWSNGGWRATMDPSTGVIVGTLNAAWSGISVDHWPTAIAAGTYSQATIVLKSSLPANKIQVSLDTGAGAPWPLLSAFTSGINASTFTTVKIPLAQLNESPAKAFNRIAFMGALAGTITIQSISLQGAPAPTATLAASVTNVDPNATVTLTYSATNASTLFLDTKVGSAAATTETVTGTTSKTKVVAATTTYTLRANGAGGAVAKAVTITVVPLPTITSFTASPTTVTVGSASTLAWVSAGGTLALNGVAVSGSSRSVSPTANATYTLIATNNLGRTVTKQVTVTVTAAPPPPPPTTTDVVIFDGTFQNNWSFSGSWCQPTEIVTGTLHCHGSTAWQALVLNAPSTVAANTYQSITFLAKGTGPINLEVEGQSSVKVALTPDWASYTVSLPSFAPNAFSRIDFKNWNANTDFYIDNVVLTPSGPVQPPPAGITPIAYTPNTPKLVDDAQDYYLHVPASYSAGTPIVLFIWLHGCGGFSSGDIWSVTGPGQDWITIAPTGAEGSCWSMTNGPGQVLNAIAEVKTHFNINNDKIVIGGYSSGGDLAYHTAFYNASVFAGVLAENTAPFRDTGASQTASIAAAGNHKFHIVHLAHLQDTTYPIATVRTETNSLTASGFPVTRIERVGTHYDQAGASVSGAPVPGTEADVHTYLLPHLRDGWTRVP